MHIPRPIDITELETSKPLSKGNEIRKTLKKIKETLEIQKDLVGLGEVELLTDRTPVMPDFFINRAASTQRSYKRNAIADKGENRFMSPSKTIKTDSPFVKKSPDRSSARKQSKSTPKIREALWRTSV